jgi:hypothetical protein
MTKIGFALVFLLLAGKTYSQQEGYIVLIDADNDQPFHLRIGDTVYNSSGIGHLSIPHLRDSTYTMMINFPQNASRDYKFMIRINKKDQGFQLKNMGEKGWALYNWQTKELKIPLMDTGTVQSIAERGTKRNDAFSLLMSSVVNDTSVMYNAFVEDMPSADSVKKDTLKKIDQPLIVGTTNIPDSAVVKTTALVQPQKVTKPKVSYPFTKKINQKAFKNSLRITYVDAVQEGSEDTVTIFIPFAKDSTKAASKSDTSKIAAQQTKTGVDSAVGKSTSGDKKKKNDVSFSECKNQASDYDVDVLRVNILVDSTEKTRIAAAKKFLKTKCLSVKQIKMLSELFPGDKNKYEFFETAYPFVSDRDNFGQLAGLLTQDEYTRRFRENFL